MSKQSSAAAAAAVKEDTKQEHPLQAVVLCDAWGEESRWGPLVRRARTEEEEFDDAEVGGEKRPWCLLPLLNVPLLTWTIEGLASSGVDQAVIFVRDGVEQVRQWAKTSSYASPQSPILITIRPTTAVTPGDVLREVDSLQIPADFLVVQAGYVGNVDLSAKVKEFTARKVEDPYLCMSCVVAPTTTTTTSKYAVHVVSSNSRLLHYEEAQLRPKLKRVTLPLEVLQGGQESRLRIDLESVGVAICSTEVPALFTENFDYQFFYPDFVNGILTSDLLGKTICCTIIGEEGTGTTSGLRKSTEWAGVVGNTLSYDAISKAILSRRAYPLVPDENMPDDSAQYEVRRGKVYYGDDLDLSRTSKITTASLIGAHTSISDNTTISHSVISPSVSIGSNCTISNSYIFEGTTIEDGCTILDSVVGEKVKIGKGSEIETGSLIGAGVTIGSNAQLSRKSVSVEEHGEAATDGHAQLGQGAVGYLWPSEETMAAEEHDSDDEEVDLTNMRITRLGTQLESLALSDSDASSLSSLSRSSSSSALSETSSTGGGQSGDEPGHIQGLSNLSQRDDFVSECTASLDRSFAENHTVDNAVIELKTLRMASNVDLRRVRDVVIPYILGRCPDATAVPKMLARWGGLVANLTGEQEEAMVEALLTAQRYVAERDTEVKFFLMVLKALYENDVVSEDAVFAWYQRKESRVMEKYWKGALPFVKALQEASSDEEDESESE